MVRKVQVVLEDDIDGGVADETVSFALDGRAYEIDLNAKNAAKLREALAPWIASARRAGASQRQTESKPARTPRRSRDSSDIRAWAAENGIAVSTRGRISSDLRAKYEAAHS
jgi:nucleoid-associated protein Lsr2